MPEYQNMNDGLPEESGIEPVQETPAPEPVVETPPEAVEPTEESAASEEATSEGEGSEEPPKPKRKGGLVRKLEKATSQAEYYKQQYEAAVAGAFQPAPQTPAKRPGEPDINDPKYTSYEQYTADMVRFEVNWRDIQRQQQEIASKAQARYEAAKQELPDLDEAIADYEGPVTQTMLEVVRRHERGPWLAHHLVKHPEEAAKIAALSPDMQIFEMGALAFKLTQPAPKQPRNTTTQAPRPIPPVQAQSAATIPSRYDKYESF